MLKIKGIMATELDASLERDVIDELIWEPSVDETRIEVTVEDGVVNLRGVVSTYYEKYTAEDAASRVRGISLINNEINVELKAAYARTDNEISATASNALIWDTTVPEENISLSVKDGWITLSGKVDWNYQKVNGANAVLRIAGVKGVTNKIVVEPTAELENPAVRIKDAMVRDALVDPDKIRVTVKGTKATLEGRVTSHIEKGRAEKAAWSTPGIASVENNIDVNVS